MASRSMTRAALMTGRRYPAAEALRIGLVSEVVEEADLRERAVALAATIAANPTEAVRYGQACWRISRRA